MRTSPRSVSRDDQPAEAEKPLPRTKHSGQYFARIEPSPRTAWFLVGVLMCVSAALALFSLTNRSIWIDEALTKSVATAPSERLFEDLAYNGGNMSLYLMLMRGWLVLGDSDWWLRLPSVLLAVASIPAFFVLARRFVRDGAAAVGAGLVALSPPLMHHAQDARAYSLSILLVMISWLAALKMVDAPSRSSRRWYVALAVALVYSHLMGLLFVGAQLVWLGSVRRRDALTAGAWIGALAIPQLVMALGPQANEPSWLAPTNPWTLMETLRYLTGTTSFITAGVAGGALVLSAYVVRTRGDHASLVPIAWVLLPVVAVLAISLQSPMLYPRYLLMVIPGMLLLICIALDARPKVGALLVLVLVAVTLPKLQATLTRDGPDWRAATHLVIERAEDDEAVLFINSRQLVEHYWDEAGRPTPVPVSLSSPAEWGDLRRNYDLDVRSAVAVLDNVNGAWVVQRQTNSDVVRRKVISEIERRWPEMSSWSLDDGAINITRYGNH